MRLLKLIIPLLITFVLLYGCSGNKNNNVGSSELKKERPEIANKDLFKEKTQIPEEKTHSQIPSVTDNIEDKPSPEPSVNNSDASFTPVPDIYLKSPNSTSPPPPPPDSNSLPPPPPDGNSPPPPPPGAPPPPPDAIESIDPYYAIEGQQDITVTIIIKEHFAPPPDIIITGVKIGSVSGGDIERDGPKVTAKFSFPSDEKAEFKDVSVEFPGPYNNTVILKRPDAFQLIGK